MATLRISLDPCGAGDGPLRVLVGSHRHGRLSQEEVARCVREGEERLCCLGAGDALLMRPLVVHASSKAAQPRRRRVVHVELAAGEMPAPLEWHERFPLGALATMDR